MEAKKTWVQEDYMLGRGFRESASCWLLDLAHQSPPTWQLEGVDVSSLQYPVDEYLPKNILLKTMDAFGKIPEDMIEKFDVVHVRAFGVIVTHSDPMPLLKNLVSMLKPGGYLQWDEIDVATFCAHAPNPHTETKSCDELLRIFNLLSRETGLDFRWISNLPSSFKSCDLELVDSIRLPPINDIRKASTDNYMLGIEEIGAIAAEKSSALLGSHEKFRELLKNGVQENQRGVSLEIDMVVVVGRKAIG